MYNKLLQKYKSGITFFNELAVFFLIHLHTLYNIDQPSNGRNIEFVLTQTQHLYPHIKYSQRTGIHYCCLRTILIFIQRAGKILALLWFLWFFYILKRTCITLVGKHSSNQIELILFLLKFNNNNMQRVICTRYSLIFFRISVFFFWRNVDSKNRMIISRYAVLHVIIMQNLQTRNCCNGHVLQSYHINN